MENLDNIEESASKSNVDGGNEDNNNTRANSVRKEPFWVFGYGSLCWNPGFEYQQSITGYIKGFSRRFWQGNTTHRGTDLKPGRVATLIEDKEGVTWGKAFLVAADDHAALPYLTNRECQLGGYKTYTVNFYPRSFYVPSNSSNLPTNNSNLFSNDSELPSNNSDLPSNSSNLYENSYYLPPNIANGFKHAVLYIAVPENRHWLGAAPLPEIAKQILECHGSSGSNVEYLLRLADFMREEVPEALDEHLFSLERLVRKFASDTRICLQMLMRQGNQSREDQEQKAVVPSNQFASRIPDKKLRCVNM